ncbi:AAA family ATPase [Pseudomonas fontis]|uniref:AAA family ATPase n=1 Tax=Pseudomonas fontis TaxID=2942633 RepID=A0ABT5P0U8_9PSED|nr:AAA family ATPase [Pseudomonas fontis]MDD0977493.1 AAA family ATPase [Pseudomonas fontis]MDD0994081.1 AAA family ATPase [Pseudomonas fontis]
MKLETLTLQNFRCFESVEVDLHPSVTVLVAENGQGKSALLDAVRVALWPYVSSYDLARSALNDPGNGIAIDDVRLMKLDSGDMARQLPSRVQMKGDFGTGPGETWIRYRDSEAKGTKTKDESGTAELKHYASTLQRLIRSPSDAPASLPVFGYYGTGRLWSQKRLMETHYGKKDTAETDFYVRTFAYVNCLDPASSYKHFKEWFIWAFESLREEQIKQLERPGSAVDLHIARQRIQVVQQAIDCFLKPSTGWNTLEYSVSQQKSLILHHAQHGTLDVDMLSDGIRSILAMVGDIAYRCIKLNPHLGLDAALKTVGVVMIDEVDMHLHPTWQQRVIGQLTSAFPQIQFIVTTHSPQVISTVPAASIRVLSSEQDALSGQTRTVIRLVTQQTQGVASSDVMADVMGTDPVPDIAAAHQLSEYKALIEQGLKDTPEANELLHRLTEHFGTRHPELLDCQRLIRLQILKDKRPSKTSGA